MRTPVLVWSLAAGLAATLACTSKPEAPPPPPADWTSPGVEVLATTVHQAAELALGGGGVWWVELGGSIVELPEGRPQFRPFLDLDEPYSLALDGPTVFWSDSTGISACNAPACADRRLVARSRVAYTPETAGQQPQGIVLDEERVYWVEGWEIRSCPRIGCPAAGPTVLATEEAISLLYHSLAADAANLYWVRNGGEVMTIPKSGGAPRVIVKSGPPYVEGVAVDSTAVYWTAFDLENGVFSAQVLRASLDGSKVTVLEEVPGVAYDLAVDETSVYFTANVAQAGIVARVDKTTGAVATGADVLASNEGNPASIAVDDGYVYWAAGGGTISRHAK